MPPAKSFGSYAGRLVNASTSPVRGSITTAAPLKPPALKPSSAARCRSMSMVSCTRRPSCAGISSSVSISRPMLLTLTQPRAVLAHQQLVVDLLDAGLPDDGAAAAALRFRSALRWPRRRSRTDGRQTNRPGYCRVGTSSTCTSGSSVSSRRARTAATCASDASSTTTIGR